MILLEYITIFVTWFTNSKKIHDELPSNMFWPHFVVVRDNVYVNQTLVYAITSRIG
jgi:hypothetical protein